MKECDKLWKHIINVILISHWRTPDTNRRPFDILHKLIHFNEIHLEILLLSRKYRINQKQNSHFCSYQLPQLHNVCSFKIENWLKSVRMFCCFVGNPQRVRTICSLYYSATDGRTVDNIELRIVRKKAAPPALSSPSLTGMHGVSHNICEGNAMIIG